ncbi:hypothetical protein EGM70_14980 [Enterobacteriaceae bacterium 89]|nr:hypothetical protein [Enterobacteriaceae bacterium 89]
MLNEAQRQFPGFSKCGEDDNEMCCTSNFCDQKIDFSCGLIGPDPDSLKRFSVVRTALHIRVTYFFSCWLKRFNSAREESHVPVISSGYSSRPAGRE